MKLRGSRFIKPENRCLSPTWQERRIGTDPATGKPYEMIEFEVSGDRIQAVHMLPGYTHNIINLSETENLVTLMWANEIFDPAHPDTFFEPV